MTVDDFDTALWPVIEGCETILADVKSWWQWRNKEDALPAESFAINFTKYPEFRSLMNHRFKVARFDRRLLPKLPLANDLYINDCEIGGGFRIQHGHSTWVMAEKIGKNFHVNQNVTIGAHRGRMPTIGDNVKIFTGAVVVGGVAIGDNVMIAPNAFVNFDVPPNKKVFPARSIIV